MGVAVRCYGVYAAGVYVAGPADVRPVDETLLGS